MIHTNTQYPQVLPDGSKIFLCISCHEEFAVTKDGLDYFEKLGHGDDPKRCKFCNRKRKKEEQRRAQVFIQQ